MQHTHKLAGVADCTQKTRRFPCTTSTACSSLRRLISRLEDLGCERIPKLPDRKVKTALQSAKAIELTLGADTEGHNPGRQTVPNWYSERPSSSHPPQRLALHKQGLTENWKESDRGKVC